MVVVAGVDRRTTSVQVEGAGDEAVRVNPLILAQLKAYLLTDVLPLLTDQPDYQDSEDYRNKVLSAWVETAIKSALKEEGFYSRRKGESESLV
jgi:hypothetical protein